MNCPNCDFRFKNLLVNADEVPDVAPLLCEDCLKVSILVHGQVRKATPEEMSAIMESPAWREMIEPAIRAVRNVKMMRNAHKN